MFILFSCFCRQIKQKRSTLWGVFWVLFFPHANVTSCLDATLIYRTVERAGSDSTMLTLWDSPGLTFHLHLLLKDPFRLLLQFPRQRHANLMRTNPVRRLPESHRPAEFQLCHTAADASAEPYAMTSAHWTNGRGEQIYRGFVRLMRVDLFCDIQQCVSRAMHPIVLRLRKLHISLPVCTLLVGRR